MNIPRTMTALAIAVGGVYASYSLSGDGIVAQALALVSALALVIVILAAGWEGFAIIFFTYSCTIACCYMALLPFATVAAEQRRKRPPSASKICDVREHQVYERARWACRLKKIRTNAAQQSASRSLLQN